jgi:CheY-like chemotaxis protein
MAVILVVDDEEMIRSLVKVVLTSAGHSILTAANGLEAIALFRSFRSRIDLVITDLKMPVVDGYEVVRTILKDQPGTRIICMTGYSDEPVPQKTILMLKPFLPNQLRTEVEHILKAG